MWRWPPGRLHQCSVRGDDCPDPERSSRGGSAEPGHSSETLVTWQNSETAGKHVLQSTKGWNAAQWRRFVWIQILGLIESAWQDYLRKPWKCAKQERLSAPKPRRLFTWCMRTKQGGEGGSCPRHVHLTSLLQARSTFSRTLRNHWPSLRGRGNWYDVQIQIGLKTE